MENTGPQQPSPFALMVDGLRNKTDEEIKLLYLRAFATDLEAEWKAITTADEFEHKLDAAIDKAEAERNYTREIYEAWIAGKNNKPA